VPGGAQAVGEHVERCPIRHPQRGVRLARRRERLLDADVEAGREPDAAAGAQRLGLRDLLERASQPGGAATWTWSRRGITR
jgi:hypothetical protein